MPLLVTTLTWTPRNEPYSADVLPVWTWTSSTASWIGRMLVIASRFALELMPSSVMLFWICRWPAPRKLKPMSLVFPARTPGVVLASAQTLRPDTGSSDTARSSIVWDSAARSVASTVAFASTVMVSARAPTVSTASRRTTWLPATSTPVAWNVRNPSSATVIE